MTPRTPYRAPASIPSAIELGARSDMNHLRPAALTQLAFYNGLGRTITVVYRNGLKVLIPHTVNAARQALMVRSSVFLDACVNPDSTALLNDDGREGTPESRLLAKGLSRNLQEWTSHGGSMQATHLDYFITLHELEQNGSSMYLENLDVVISLMPPAMAPCHPFSLQGAREGLMSPRSTGGGLEYRIEIYDQDGLHGDRFINISGEVFCIRVNRSGTRRNGVYVYGHAPQSTVSGPTQERTHFYDFEEADQRLHLYQSYNEALTLGNPSDVYKREIEAAQHELKVNEARAREEARLRDIEFESLKRAFEREREHFKADQARQERRLKEREAQLEDLEHQYRLHEHELKMESLRRKDVYEERSTTRKDWSETLKFLPAAIMLLAAGYGAYKKYISDD